MIVQMPACDVDVGDEILIESHGWLVDFVFCAAPSLMFYCGPNVLKFNEGVSLDVRLGNGRAHLHQPITEVRRVERP